MEFEKIGQIDLHRLGTAPGTEHRCVKMPPKKEVEKKKARRNKRKSRTEGEFLFQHLKLLEMFQCPSGTNVLTKCTVESSPSSSDNEEAPSPSGSPSPSPQEDTFPTPKKTAISKPTPPSKVQQDKSFHSFYLQQSTREFANDLDKLRSAGDFHGERSVQMLVRALGKGVACFEEGEKGRVVGAGGV